ncbi:MAG: Coenzyme F420 hydrogenase/dehydrogenase, beta subunit C-terminal domain [Eubacterium sp.]|nr:Coenzyme F420 hydrogenase/dehydrogenase, beta subunit C-terminal domain [Eubacterium sp.]
MIKTDKNCIGCGACADACPVNCITMEYDEEGFLYPTVNTADCINCSSCNKVCIIENNIPEIETIKAYAAFSKNEERRRDSSSGAIFYELSKSVLDKGGVVFGAAFDNEWNVKHIACESISDLHKLQKSKYVQSDTSGIFKHVKAELEAKRSVIFTGTPCQCNALHLYLGKEYENLLLVDFICHGVPSPMVWQKYIAAYGKEKIVSVNFRDKSDGWKNYNFFVETKEEAFKHNFWSNPYMRLFLSDYILRPSCYQCKSKFPHKSADITMGDLWGAENIVNELDDDKGLSLIVINTPKGKSAIDQLDNIVSKTIDMSEAFRHNPSAVNSADIPNKREKLLCELKQDNNPNFEKYISKYLPKPNIVKKAAKKLLSFIR